MHFHKPSKSIVKISTNPDDIYDFWSRPAQQQFFVSGSRVITSIAFAFLPQGSDPERKTARV